MASTQGDSRESSEPPVTEQLKDSAGPSPTGSRPVSPSSSAEKPVRQQLKEASIEEKRILDVPETVSEEGKDAPTKRATHKRDHEALAEDAPEEANGKSRKREKGGEHSAESAEGIDKLHKRARDEDDTAEPSDGQPNSPKRRSVEVQRETSAAANGTKTSGGFANASTQSPFSAVPKSKSPEPASQTSASAFASSGFASFASASASPFASSALKTNDTADKPNGNAAPKASFASLSGSTSSPFASAGTKSSVFGGGSSAFGSGTSGFGKLAGGFGSSSGSAFGAASGGPRSSFASPPAESKSDTNASRKPARAFGAPAEDDEDDEGEDGDDDKEDGEAEAVVGEKDDQKDERFYEQEVQTGEEDEDTKFTTLAKLYILESGAWKERGVGNIKINTRKDEQTKSRFVMRAKGSQKLVLNSPVIAECKPVRNETHPARILFTAFDITDNKPKSHQLKMKTPKECEEIHSVIIAAMSHNVGTPLKSPMTLYTTNAALDSDTNSTTDVEMLSNESEHLKRGYRHTNYPLKDCSESSDSAPSTHDYQDYEEHDHDDQDHDTEDQESQDYGDEDMEALEDWQDASQVSGDIHGDYVAGHKYHRHDYGHGSENALDEFTHVSPPWPVDGEVMLAVPPNSPQVQKAQWNGMGLHPQVCLDDVRGVLQGGCGDCAINQEYDYESATSSLLSDPPESVIGADEVAKHREDNEMDRASDIESGWTPRSYLDVWVAQHLTGQRDWPFVPLEEQRRRLAGQPENGERCCLAGRAASFRRAHSC